VTQIGSEARTRGAGRPAFSAAAVIVGTVWEASVAGPVIHVTVPSAIVAARRNICSPSAAITTGGVRRGSTPMEIALLIVSPWNEHEPSWSNGMSTDKYSRM
jgi:hypothetical protein